MINTTLTVQPSAAFICVGCRCSAGLGSTSGGQIWDPVCHWLKGKKFCDWLLLSRTGLSGNPVDKLRIFQSSVKHPSDEMWTCGEVYMYCTDPHTSMPTSISRVSLIMQNKSQVCQFCLFSNDTHRQTLVDFFFGNLYSQVAALGKHQSIIYSSKGKSSSLHGFFLLLFTSKASTCWFSFSIPVLSNSFMRAITTSWRSTSHASLIYFSVDSTEAPLPVCSKSKHNNRLCTRSRQHLGPVSVQRVTNVFILLSFCSPPEWQQNPNVPISPSLFESKWTFTLHCFKLLSLFVALSYF